MPWKIYVFLKTKFKEVRIYKYLEDFGVSNKIMNLLNYFWAMVENGRKWHVLSRVEIKTQSKIDSFYCFNKILEIRSYTIQNSWEKCCEGRKNYRKF